MSVSDWTPDPGLLADSKGLTDRYRDHIFVGMSTESYAEATKYAWEQARGRFGGPARLRVIEKWAVAENPLTNYLIAISTEPLPG